MNISDSKMNVDFNFLDCPRLVAKCSLKSVSPTFYDKRDDFTFPLVNFPFSSSNIPALPSMEFTFHNSYIILELVSSTVIFWTERRR
jgi:hypothetical protein